MAEGNEKRLPKKEAFLAALGLTGNITRAAILSDINKCSHYRWVKEDPGYQARFDEAMEEACDHLETEARRRAVEGVDEPVYHEGMCIDTVKKYSDTLLIFLLKGARPKKYKDRFMQIEHSGTISLATALTEATKIITDREARMAKAIAESEPQN